MQATACQQKEVGKRVEVVGLGAGRPVVNLKIGGQNVRALIDTGATCTLLRLETFRTLNETLHRPRYLRSATQLRGSPAYGNTSVPTLCWRLATS